MVRKKLTTFDFGPNDESDLLLLLNSHKHEKIIRLLSAYSQNGVPSLIFERADMNLHQFMFQKARAKHFTDDRAILKAIHGLSSGLKYIHSFGLGGSLQDHTSATRILGCHQDIKPRNVLVRGSDFLLADFGLMRQRTREEDSRTLWKNGTFEYGAPECRDPETLRKGKVGRASDVWSFGCIISELLVYLKRGPDGVSNFRAIRLMENVFGQTRCFHDNAGPSQQVMNYLSDMEIETDELQLSPTAELYSLIQLMLVASPQDRPHAGLIESGLSRITTRVLIDDLLLAIDSCFSRSTSSPAPSVFRVRLRMEEKRLRAWVSLLELGVAHENSNILDTRRFTSLLQIWQALELAIEDINIHAPFEAKEVNENFTIDRLRQTNDIIFGHLSDADRASADSIFATLTIEDQETRALLLQTSDHSSRDSRYQDIGAIAAMRYMSILLAKQPEDLELGPRLDQALVASDGEAIEDEKYPETYWYNVGHRDADQKRVIIEYKDYGDKWKKDTESEEFEETGKIQFERIQKLVTMLRKPRPEGFQALDCLGCFHDFQKHRFGIVYELPSNDSSPIRLHYLLQKKNPSSKTVNHPGVRISLAKVLVKSFHMLHLAGWVHKDINSRNILFLPLRRDYSNVDLTQPFIVGFHYSRQDEERAYTEGPAKWKKYEHPDYQTSLTPFKKEYDYYSLGLVLLEIGAWEGLSKLYSKYPKEDAFQLRQRYIHICDNQILARMGPKYHAATKKCLMADSQLNGDDLDSAIDFQRDVVDVLESCNF